MSTYKQNVISQDDVTLVSEVKNNCRYCKHIKWYKSIIYNMKTLFQTIVTCAVLFVTSTTTVLAQDVTFDLSKYTSIVNDQATCSDGVTSVKYILDQSTKAGAYITGGFFKDTYCLTISSTKKISVIEFDGFAHSTNSAKTTDLNTDSGTLHMHPNETSMWEGNSSSIKVYGESSSTYYVFTKIRIWYVGTSYGKTYVEDPIINVQNGNVTFSSNTEEVSFKYNLQLNTDEKYRMSNGTASVEFPLVIKVHGEAKDMENSTTITKSINLSALYGLKGDTDGDGKLSSSDILVITNNILNKTEK